jgi:hypothetical protein
VATGSSTLGASKDKRGHEVDFVIATHRKRPAAIECKWSANNFDPTNLIAFRYQHPEGENLVLAHDVERAFTRGYGDLTVHFDGLRSFADAISSQVLFRFERAFPARN